MQGLQLASATKDTEYDSTQDADMDMVDNKVLLSSAHLCDQEIKDYQDVPQWLPVHCTLR